ncbi:MAG: rubrerythrin family protein [Clostridia bacterium]|nr:rubrerythrin family protein [Clostridia bacterium]
MDFKTSETRKNLMRAFAGESQARNRYTFAANAAKSKNLYVIEAVFEFTANQEKAHAKVFFDYLKELAGSEVIVDGGYPVEEFSDIRRALRNARENEKKEYDEVYKSFGEIAEQEGFLQIANTFREIADIEKIHSERFNCFLKMMENDTLFVSNVETGWMCLNCGHISYGKSAPKICPVCRHDQGYFIRLELVPFGGKFGA